MLSILGTTGLIDCYISIGFAPDFIEYLYFDYLSE